MFVMTDRSFILIRLRSQGGTIWSLWRRIQQETKTLFQNRWNTRKHSRDKIVQDRSIQSFFPDCLSLASFLDTMNFKERQTGIRQILLAIKKSSGQTTSRQRENVDLKIQ